MSLNPLKQHPLVTLGVIIFFAVTALVVFRLSSGARTDARKSRVITVGTAAPIKQDLDVRLSYTADLIPNQLVNIFSRVDGYIAKMYVDKGDLVKANQLLIERTTKHGGQTVASVQSTPWLAVVDREEAITRAVVGAYPGDLVLIAGKGH